MTAPLPAGAVVLAVLFAAARPGAGRDPALGRAVFATLAAPVAVAVSLRLAVGLALVAPLAWAAWLGGLAAGRPRSPTEETHA